MFKVDSLSVVTEEKHQTEQESPGYLVTARVCVALALWLWLTPLRSLWSKRLERTHSCMIWFLPNRRTVMSSQQFQGFNWHDGSFPVSRAFKIQSHILSAAFPSIHQFHMNKHTEKKIIKCSVYFFLVNALPWKHAIVDALHNKSQVLWGL